MAGSWIELVRDLTGRPTPDLSRRHLVEFVHPNALKLLFDEYRYLIIRGTDAGHELAVAFVVLFHVAELSLSQRSGTHSQAEPDCGVDQH